MPADRTATPIADSMRGAAPARTAEFRPDIQGLRAIAVGAVLLYHAGLPFVPGGFIGVDVFFVISGYLITGHLLGSLQGSSRLDFASFYARRARRILPAAIVVLVLTVVAAVIVVPPLRLGSILRDAVFSALYIPNLHFAAEETDYLAGSAPSPFQHYWSLGVEEQFYLFWPLALVGLAALARVGATRVGEAQGSTAQGDTSQGGGEFRFRIRLLIGITVVTIASFVSCLVVALISSSWAFFGTPMRAWELTLGAAVACLASTGIVARGRAAALGGWLGLGAIVASALLFSTDSAYPSTLTAIPVIGTAAVLFFGIGSSAPGPLRVLRARPLQFIGLISYSLYLVHWPVIVLAQEAAGTSNPLPLWMTVLLTAVSVPLAWVLYLAVERPMRVRKLRDRRHGRRTLAATGVVTLTLVGALVGGTMAVAAAPLNAGRPTTSAPLAQDPAGTDFVPSNLTPSLSGATRDTGEIYSNGCQQNIVGAELLVCEYGVADADFTIALFGDSHAGRWFTALDEVATARQLKLVTYTKSRCRSEESDDLWAQTKEPSCAAWRSDALAALTADPPDLIVLTNHIGPMPDRDPQILEQRWQDVTAESIARLPSASRVVVIADTPEFSSSPVDCLSGNLDSASVCAVPRSEGVNIPVMNAQRAAAASDGAGYVDLTDYLCGEKSCPAIIGDTLVYSDDHHLTASIGRMLAAPLDGALAPYLP